MKQVEQELVQAALTELEFPKVIQQIASLCLSELGREKVLELRPTTDLEWLQREHGILEEMVRLLRQGVPFPWTPVPDVRRQLRKSTIENAMLLPTELVDVRELLQLSRAVRQELIRQAELPLLRALGEQLYQNRLLERHISDAVDETGGVRDAASRELARIRAEMQRVAASLRTRLRRILRRFVEDELAMDEFITQREGRFVVPIRVEHKNHIPGIIHGVSQTGATVFLEPAEIFELNNELALLADAERREIERILRVLTAEVGSCAAELLHSLEILALLDSLYARARYAVLYGGQKPTIAEDGEIVLQQIVHPLLVAARGRSAVVPLDIEFRSTVRGHLISGPNAGGKTVALKSVGLNILLALSGIFPLGYCRTPVLTVLTAIGDQQSIEQNLSTFSWQVVRIRDILQCSGPRTLVLIDEICAGTDPTEGAALASAIIEELLHRQAYFVVTTHQSSLKVFALHREGIQNDSLEFDQARLQPTYRFLPGVPGNSYAFAIAANFGLPESLIRRAEAFLGSRHRELEEGIAAVQALRQQWQQLEREARERAERAQQLLQRYEEQLRHLQQRRTELLGQTRQEVRQLFQQAQSLIERTIREIREQQRPLNEIRQEFLQKREAILQALSVPEEEPSGVASEVAASFAPGMWVRMEGMQTPGRILELDEHRRMAVVEFDGLKLHVGVEKLQPAKPPREGTARPTDDVPLVIAPTSVDVRGMRAIEAISTVDRFLAKALQGNALQVRIIHGKGTGALRQALHQFLATHPAVAEYRLADATEGGAGVTIVTLR
ncbi:MAG: endonuclease MutS2 [Candidatus Kapabacteria bacterium]|nr:endonuclease MutS2 [Candidatus Kapabacteria bacterium]MDW8012637.1 endonuclease MutS2 [Bacteroidota bacterium]